MGYIDLVNSLKPDGYWPLNDAVGSTTAKDFSGNGKDLSNGATACTFGAAAVLPGEVSVAASAFTGSALLGRQGADGGYWDRGSGADFAVSAWVTGMTGNHALTVFAIDDGNGSFFILYSINSASTNGPRIWCGNSAMNGTGLSIQDGGRHHVITQRASNVVSVYVDGVADPTTLSNSSALTMTTSHWLSVGAITTGGSAYANSGREEHVAYWKRSLSAAERSLLYQGGARAGDVTG